MVKKTCSVKNCFKSCHYLDWGKRGFCANHYALWRRNGSPIKRKRNPNGGGTISRGYKLIYINGKQIHQHKHIMQKFLKRKLIFPYEIVHHKNGNKLDNRIENLEVMSQSTHLSCHNLKCILTKTHKTCTQCKKILTHDRFSHCKNTIGHLRSNCKSCQNIYNKKRLACK